MQISYTKTKVTINGGIGQELAVITNFPPGSGWKPFLMGKAKLRRHAVTNG